MNGGLDMTMTSRHGQKKGKATGTRKGHRVHRDIDMAAVMESWTLDAFIGTATYYLFL